MDILKIHDLVKYSTGMNPHVNWGVVVEILTIKDSVHENSKGISLYRINPIDNSLGYDLVEEKNIKEAYSKHY